MQAVVLGAGLLGLEAAKAVYDIPSIKEVTIVHRQSYPLSRQLDAQGGEIVLRRIEAMGVRFLGGFSVQRLITNNSGALSGVELSDARRVSLELHEVYLLDLDVVGLTGWRRGSK